MSINEIFTAGGCFMISSATGYALYQPAPKTCVTYQYINTNPIVSIEGERPIETITDTAETIKGHLSITTESTFNPITIEGETPRLTIEQSNYIETGQALGHHLQGHREQLILEMDNPPAVPIVVEIPPIINVPIPPGDELRFNPYEIIELTWESSTEVITGSSGNAIEIEEEASDSC